MRYALNYSKYVYVNFHSRIKVKIKAAPADLIGLRVLSKIGRASSGHFGTLGKTES